MCKKMQWHSTCTKIEETSLEISLLYARPGGELSDLLITRLALAAPVDRVVCHFVNTGNLRPGSRQEAITDHM